MYVDALILRDRDTAGNGTLAERLYVLQDANWNVTALVNTAGVVQERSIYSPYGAATLLNSDWSSRMSSPFAWIFLHQGGRLATATGLYDFRNREVPKSSAFAIHLPRRKLRAIGYAPIEARSTASGRLGTTF